MAAALGDVSERLLPDENGLLDWNKAPCTAQQKAGNALEEVRTLNARILTLCEAMQKEADSEVADQLIQCRKERNALLNRAKTKWVKCNDPNRAKTVWAATFSADEFNKYNRHLQELLPLVSQEAHQLELRIVHLKMDGIDNLIKVSNLNKEIQNLLVIQSHENSDWESLQQKIIPIIVEIQAEQNLLLQRAEYLYLENFNSVSRDKVECVWQYRNIAPLRAHAVEQCLTSMYDLKNWNRLTITANIQSLKQLAAITLLQTGKFDAEACGRAQYPLIDDVIYLLETIHESLDEEEKFDDNKFQEIVGRSDVVVYHVVRGLLQFLSLNVKEVKNKEMMAQARKMIESLLPHSEKLAKAPFPWVNAKLTRILEEMPKMQCETIKIQYQIMQNTGSPFQFHYLDVLDFKHLDDQKIVAEGKAFDLATGLILQCKVSQKPNLLVSIAITSVSEEY